MGADKTNNIMTLSSGVSQPLLADVQYFELYSSSALNRKLKNIVLPGFYCGFEPVPGTGLSVRITSENSEGKGAASVDVNNVQISVQQIEDVTVSVKAGATNIIVLEANFEHGVKTTQVESASSVSAARIYARTDNTIGQNQIELCRVIVPNGATAVTKEMIVLKYRVNRAVGVEFSNEISSTEERKAATPLAVKTLHDLVDTKAPLDSPHLSGTPTSPTPEPGTNNTQIANAAFVKAAITALINGAPGTLDTLKEIAAAINNDPNFSTTINNALALKAPLASPALTGIPTAPTAAQGTNNTQIATTAYVRAAISALVGSSPEALDTLNELAAALGNDPNFATTMTNALAGKQPLDATLTALAALATGANKLPYFTGKDTVAQTDLTSVGRDILAKTSTLAVIQYLGLRELGTSGEKIPLLSTANTWSARQTFNGGITGALTGNADTATKLKTARTIGGVAFDGSANINLPGVNTTGNQNTTGNAATATKLATARNINGVKFDGSGDVNINTLVSRGRVTALSGSTQGTAGIQMYEAYNNSYPTTYGNVLHMKGASAAGEGELLIGWSGTSGAHAPVFIRSRRDNTDAAWSAWAQVYTSKDSIPGVNTTGNQNTTGNAASATKLQTARTINGVSFDGSANISLSPANIGCPASPTGWLVTGDNGASITTEQLVTLLRDNGAFNAKAWIARCAWAYANSASIPDSETGCGIIPLAGAVIEVFNNGNSSNNYTIRITTATTTGVSGALTNAEFVYVFNGTTYSPGWRRAYNTKNKPTAADVGALPLSGGALTGGLTAAGEIISKSANGLRIAYGNYGFFIRNDGSNTYFMLTDSGNSLGTYNRLRPLIINNANGAVTIGNGLNVTGGINGSLNGNAATATKLQTARTIGGVSFDGSANINLPGVNIAGNQNTTGNAATATKLQTARTINGVSFDGSKNIELTAEDLNLEQTVELAAGALQKNQNGADIPGKDTFTKNIGACRAFHSAISTGAGNWTTAQLIEWLDSQGAFNHPYWMCKCLWSYGNNKIITDTGCGTIHLAGCVIEVMGNKGAMTIRVTTPSTSSGGGTTNAQFTYINHGDDYAPGWRRDYNTKNQQPAFALGKTGGTVGNDKAVGWNWNSGVYNANIGGATTLILHFNMSEGSCPAVQFRVNYKNGGIFYRSARDGYGFEANWSEFYTTTRKPSAGDVGAYTQAECNSRFITGIRLGGLSSVQTWNGPGWSDRSGYVVTGSVNGNRDELIDTTQARPIQYCINGTWYNAGSI
ncbi:tail fiber protein [Escherichia coli]|uniref:phage tail fiber protein n=2 Tax=Escherichia coli TaxID=562 RepID=UPI0018F59068|nr:tail fiber protein [Escherichia coli]MBJ7992761.1 tail fiber protein [Escherichia coli]QWK04408.1 tail fiber protein [Escherichia coli]